MSDARTPLTVQDLKECKARGERIVTLTCYDVLFARLLDECGVDVLLVGDSVNQLLAGAETTLSATLDQMIYHTKSVRRGSERALVICDMPFLTYQVSREEAIRNCGRVLAETGCQGVKVEGGQPIAGTVRALPQCPASGANAARASWSRAERQAARTARQLAAKPTAWCRLQESNRARK